VAKRPPVAGQPQVLGVEVRRVEIERVPFLPSGQVLNAKPEGTSYLRSSRLRCPARDQIRRRVQVLFIERGIDTC
jgi:hypothetical protein